VRGQKNFGIGASFCVLIKLNLNLQLERKAFAQAGHFYYELDINRRRVAPTRAAQA
jgi:hypothetical protein